MSEELLVQFSGITFSALKQLQIHRYHPDYEDLMQIGQLTLLKVAETFDGDPFTSEKYQFVAFAKQKCVWTMIDYLRQQNKHAWMGNDDATELDDLTMTDSIETELEIHLACLKLLPKKHHTLFKLLYSHQLTKTEIASKLQISRKTLYQKIHVIRKYLAPIYKELTL